MENEIIYRLITFLLLTTALVMSGYFRRKADREGGRMQTSEGQKLVVILRLLGLIVILPLLGYLINPAWVAWARFSLPDSVRWAAALIAIATLPVFYWVLVSIGVNISPTQATRQNHKLVTHGPYRWVRHPLYTTGFICALALTALTTLWWLGMAMPLPLIILLLRTSREEANLVETFGDEYREYMKRAGQFFPKLLR
ncbi:MAG: isoprenylcysteine carboxylmethyltransferase family protein [Chloroflexi bacterium]|nr:isoprenylcysteine carboxylmethyltransferase family protein [Chloroflexota bacterium]